MRIAIFSDNFYPEISGISDSIILLAKELVRMGWEVHFFVPKYSKKEFALANVTQGEIDVGARIRVHRMRSFPYPGSPTKQARIVIPLLQTTRVFKRKKFDVIYSQSPFGVGLEALLVAKLYSIPLVGTNHTPIAEFVRYFFVQNALVKKVAMRYFSWYYNRCMLVTAPYGGLLEDMRKYGFHAKAKVISNPVELESFHAVSEGEKKTLKAKYGLSSATVLYTGRLSKEKCVNEIIAAFQDVLKAVPEADFVITGSGRDENNLKDLAKSLGISSHVKFFGRVDDATHTELYQAADVFAIMSTAETQSLSLMKAMAASLPVVVADAGALPTHVNTRNGFVVGAHDTKGLSRDIICLLHDKQMRNRLGSEGFAYVKQFSAKHIAEQWMHMFNRVIKK